MKSLEPMFSTYWLTSMHRLREPVGHSHDFCLQMEESGIEQKKIGVYMHTNDKHCLVTCFIPFF